MKMLWVYIVVPMELEGKPTEDVNIKDVDTLKIPKYIKLKELSNMLGAKI